MILALALALFPQEPFSQPQDARQVITWDRYVLPSEDADWDALSHRFLCYHAVGAAAEADEAIDGMLAIDPTNPDALRFRIHADSRRPERNPDTLSACADWLRMYDNGTLPADRVQEVKHMQALLRLEEERRDSVRAAAARARLLPLLGLAVLVAFTLAARRFDARASRSR